MITVYIGHIDSEFINNSFEKSLIKLPDSMIRDIQTCCHMHDRKLRLLGKLLLSDQLKYYSLDKTLLLSNIQINKYGRPSFEHSFDFNISHSGKFAICAAGLDIKIGIDIQEMKEAEFADFNHLFSKNEWNLIIHDRNPQAKFFEFWTRKEAISKIFGTGIPSFQDFEVIDDSIVIEGQQCQIVPLDIHSNYKTYLAYAGKKNKNIKVYRRDSLLEMY